MDNQINLMITGVGGGGHGEQILKALRLASTNYKIVGGDMSPMSKGLVEVDIPYILPPADHPQYLSSLLAVCKKENVQALFHGSEPELKIMGKERNRIKEAGLFLPINPEPVIQLCMDKYQTFQFLAGNNFYVPKTVEVTKLEDVENISFLPAILKPSIGGGGSVNVFLAQTFEELYSFCKYLIEIYPKFIVQQYVGTPDEEYTVGILISMDGELLNSIAVKRNILSSLSNSLKVPNKTEDKSLGPILAVSSGISQGEIGKFPHITKSCEDIALKLGSRGAVNIQCRFVEGKVYIFEINPRFSGTTSLRAMAGYNEPDTLIRKHLLGEDITPHFQYKSGFIMRGLHEEFIQDTNFSKAIELL
jgi:carbamoyl-phosphate synthase large subunit